MPTYEYRCKDCGEQLDVVQSFTDESLTACEACGGPLRKLFGNVGIAFKGSGFYKNDSRGKAPSSSSESKGDADKSGGDKSTGGKDGGSSKESSGKESSGKESSGKEVAKPAASPAKDAAASSSKTP